MPMPIKICKFPNMGITGISFLWYGVNFFKNHPSFEGVPDMRKMQTRQACLRNYFCWKGGTKFLWFYLYDCIWQLSLKCKSTLWFPYVIHSRANFNLKMSKLFGEDGGMLLIFKNHSSSVTQNIKLII